MPNFVTVIQQGDAAAFTCSQQVSKQPVRDAEREGQG